MSVQVGRKLIDEAEFEDLAGAKVILAERPDHARPAGFLSHLAAEKALKGLLAAINVRAPKTHDLDALVRLLGENTSETSQLDEDALDVLGPWAIRGRYPDDSPPADASEIAELVDAAERIVDGVRHIFDAIVAH